MLYQQIPSGYSPKKLIYGPYSPSRLIVAKCPQRFFGQYVRKDKNVAYSVAAARGSAIHEVFAKITEHHVSDESFTPSQLSTWISEAIGNHPASYAQADLIGRAARAYVGRPSPYIKKGKTFCEMSFAVQYVEEETFLDEVTPKSGYVQVPYAKEDGYPNPEAFFGGRLDQVTIDDEIRVVTILDHKTTPHANRDEDVNFQMGAYAWLLSLFYPDYKIRTVIHHAHPDLNFYSPPDYWDQEELREFESYIMDSIGALEHIQDFIAQPGSACDYCHMVQECPINLKLQEQRARGNIDLNVRGHSDLERLANELTAITALKDQITDALKAGIKLHANSNGVAINGRWVGFKISDEAVDWAATDMKIREESQRAQVLASHQAEFELLSLEDQKKTQFKAQLTDLEALLVHYQIDPGVFKDWKADKLKGLWRLTRPGLMECLKEFIVMNRKTTFTSHKN